MKKCIICGSNTRTLYSDLYDDRFGAPGFYSVNRCLKCGFGRTETALSKEKIGKFYEMYYPLSKLSAGVVKHSVRIRPMFMHWLSGVDNTAHRYIKKGSDVLDVGSGSGESLLEIQKMGARAFGVEPDPNAQRIAKQLKLRVYKGFITGNPFLGKKFDFVTASQVFEHEPEPLDFLRSAKEKLNNKGQIILSVPNLDSIYRKVFGRKWLNWHVPYHINFFTKLSLKKVAKKTGLKIVEIRTITPNVWTLMQFRTLLYNVNEGQKNPIWTSATSRGYKRGSVSRVRDYIFQFATMIFYVLITPINRLVDLLGGGDSLFVVLENAQ